MTARVAIDVPMDEIRAFCEKWKIVEFGIFGSAARGDMRPDSDVDVLVSFAEGSRRSLWDLPVMQEELEAIFGRDVDIVQRKGLKNPYRRASILHDLVSIYAAES